LDKPGVLSQLTNILSGLNISIEAVNQPEPEEGATEAEVVLITGRTQEKNLLAAVQSLETLDAVVGNIHKIRVETLG